MAQLINDIGLLEKKALRSLNAFYDLWKQKHRQESTSLALEAMRLKERDSLRTGILIKACAVWDTVPALRGDRLGFVNRNIPACVDLAIQALALNEERRKFRPLLWETKDSRNLHQCWFLGTHSDVGGGNKEEQGLANLSLAWMISRLEGMIAFDHGAIRDVTQAATALERCHKEPGKDTSHRCRVRQGYRSTGVYKLDVGVPVESFQARTDVQVSFLAKLQRVSGWSFRKPTLFPSTTTHATSTHESLHWSVKILLEKQIVAVCKPLEKCLAGSDIRTVAQTQCSDLERGILGTWIAHDILVLLQNDRIGIELLPLYPTLWNPDAWNIVHGERNSRLQLSIDGLIEFVNADGPQLQNAPEDRVGSKLTTLNTVQNVLHAHEGYKGHVTLTRELYIQLGSYVLQHRRRGAILSGSIEIDFQSSLDPSRKMCRLTEESTEPLTNLQPTLQ